MLPFIWHCSWQEQGGLSPGKARHCLSCLPRRTRNEKWEEEMKKEETLACEHPHGDGQTPPCSFCWEKQLSLSAAYRREGIHSDVFAGAVCSFSSQSCLEMFSWLPSIWGWSRGVKFSMLGVCFAVRKKKIKFGDSVFLEVPAPKGSFPQSTLFLIRDPALWCVRYSRVVFKYMNP